jgi:hypothetical protein
MHRRYASRFMFEHLNVQRTNIDASRFTFVHLNVQRTNIDGRTSYFSAMSR